MVVKGKYRKEIGKIGEEKAWDYLQKKGYSLVEKNFRTRYGELDIIIKKKETLIFVEVKTRVGYYLGKPHEAVNLRKIRHLKRAIQYFLLKNGYKNNKLRLDVVSIVLDKFFKVLELKHFKNLKMPIY